MSFKHKFMCLLALTEEHKINMLIVNFGLLCTFVIGNGRTVSVTLLLVTLLHSLQKTSLLCEIKNEFRNCRLHCLGTGIRFLSWRWWASSPNNFQNSWKNSTAHCCDPLTKSLVIWGKQESSAVCWPNNSWWCLVELENIHLHTTHFFPVVKS
jgi:hypothetical protein